MNSFKYAINQAKCEDIEKHLLQCSELFSPALDTYVSIPDYSKKIKDNAITVETWNSGELIGLVACYLNNDRTREGHITNVSVVHVFQGRGIAKQLICNTIEEALRKNYKTLTLEVEIDNKQAIELYRQSGFVLNGRLGSKYLMINRLLENKNVLVSICCVTYNHVEYIRDTLESFLMQKIDFPIEILIHDDASTDGTVEIVKEYERKYPEIVKPIFQKENQYSQGIGISATYQYPRARGKYIAICEGDDYWTDPNKLQKQVDFLENNTEFGLVFTDVQIIDKNNSVIENGAYNICKRYSSGWIFTELLKGNFINTCTVVLRKDLIPSSMNNPDKTWFIYDYWLWLRIAINSKICFMNEITTAYRILDNSVSRSPGFKDRRKSYYLFSDVLEAFGNENKRVLAKEEKEIILRKLISLFFQPYGSFSLKLKLLGLIAKYFPGLVGFIHILKSKYKPVSVN